VTQHVAAVIRIDDRRMAFAGAWRNATHR
jgi:hypothetical protein